MTSGRPSSMHKDKDMTLQQAYDYINSDPDKVLFDVDTLNYAWDIVIRNSIAPKSKENAQG